MNMIGNVVHVNGIFDRGIAAIEGDRIFSDLHSFHATMKNVDSIQSGKPITWNNSSTVIAANIAAGASLYRTS